MTNQHEITVKHEYQPEHETALTDQTEYFRTKLTSLLDTSEEFIISLEGIYMVKPGQEVAGERLVDNGCRGGWTQSFTAELTDAPEEVKSIKIRRPYIVTTLSYGKTGRLYRESIAETRFMVDESVWSPEAPETDFNQAIHAQLTARPYGLLTAASADELTDWRHEIRVRSRSPLEYPITYPSGWRDDPHERSAVDNTFEYVEVVQNRTTSGAIARVVISTNEDGITRSTNWVPLDQLHFYEEESSKYSAYKIYTGKLALALIEGAADTTEINKLLREVPSRYTIRRHSSYDDQTSLPLITGRHNNGSIVDIDVTQLQDTQYPESVVIDAHEVIYDHSSPWVIDESGLAVPMLRSNGFEKAKPASSDWRVKQLGLLIEAAKRVADSTNTRCGEDATDLDKAIIAHHSEPV